MRTTSASKLKKLSSIMMICALSASICPLPAHAVSGGTFVASQIQASQGGGVDNTQTISTATIQENKKVTAAAALIGSIMVTSDILGEAGNNLTVNISGTGTMPPARVDAEIIIRKSSAIFVEIRNTIAVSITQSELAEALNMSASGTLRG